ncbi:hypothetical protein P152DRAFT_404643 [Eremomyces bilateralis CBS 781.70]|uniref:Genetic interactor of prohibitins 3, mitochondrial n=1 Tax=Eremomyces bilateralis CBS 781.70 TaxID=1392243 RepID=A0A6G1FST6_9PEZI|nr:uncharacterized protein P152DRAFT_404643 [Eremomyces bilateralis CBS 781.70]KAF1808742.1 hypothetical protein P152DRAFT_404643 [Eremomyces bilateralis CBS 781.70]
MRVCLRRALSLSQTSAAVVTPRLLSRPVNVRPIWRLAKSSRHIGGSFSTYPNVSYVEAEVARDEQQDSEDNALEQVIKGQLPYSCPGCGAPTQTVDPDDAGYFSTTRGAVKAYLRHQAQPSQTTEDAIFANALQEAKLDTLQELGIRDLSKAGATLSTSPSAPICDRCHNILHHSTGVSVVHPTLNSLEATMDESPYKYNHIYHVIDAADFPMSVIPNIYRTLNLARPRTQNRRSKHINWHQGRVTQLSFIITRSDLLAPKKEQVDHMMYYLQSVLRDALGHRGQDLRLGNIHCVSSKRGWWTRQVKDLIFERGGGNWMVGKVNVGKSNLFEAVYPKGKGDDVNIQKMRQQVRAASGGERPDAYSPLDDPGRGASGQDDLALLPPPQPEVPYPVMPTISSLPGTTASPIRVPFGNGKGELIDLPGLERHSLEPYVQPEHQSKLCMTSRVVAQRLTIKPNQSLLLGGGLVRIKPVTEDVIFLAASFVPVELKPHVTSNWKAGEFQTGTRNKETGLEVITTDDAKAHIKSAGRFPLRWDVTNQQAGPLTRKDDVALKPDRLPFRVMGADILIEGCGWIEITAQIRKGKRLRQLPAEGAAEGDEKQDASTEDNGETSQNWYPREGAEEEYPMVEVFTPYGKHIGSRQCMNGYLIGGPKPKTAAEKMRKRPRMSMKSVKAQRQPQN